MEEKENIINVPVEDILPNRFQPRLAFDESELTELANSILKYGVIQPVILRKIGDKYEIVAGERRYKATVLAGLKTIPAIIKKTDDNTSAEIALLENLQRKNLTVIEEAQSFKKLLDRGFTQAEIASKMGVSQSSIANKLRLLSLPTKVQDALLFNKISERHARSLLSLNDKEKQEQLLDKIINERLTVKQTEDEINRELNNFDDVDDIPNDIRKFIERNDFIEEEKPLVEEKQEEKEEEIPQVINIDKEEYDNKEEINPFQTNFQDSIRRIEEVIQNKEESYYDKIINNDIRRTNFEFDNKVEPQEKLTENLDIMREEKEDEVVSIPSVISKVRSFIKEFNVDKNVETKEEDLPDKYKIIIEIKKED